MFDKILIANRGEIACRVIKTARRLGIRTVAVYSDADRHALHVALADEAIHIGPAPARESYLVADKIIAAAQKTGAQAIHPGYGFLSENAAFARACSDNDLVFIGPPTGAIEAMGSKSAAKQIMGTAGVPLVPGYHGADQDREVLRRAATDIGYPVLLKAAAGGGGKGMRQVWKPEEFDAALDAAKREASNAFGDDIMLVEKYLTQPRHVEIQVFCDTQGNAVYLFERDCSVQRRHQKVIEEAPAPGMTPELRARMGEAAVKAAQAIDYVGAGTVEFLLDADGAFYFMEMNTRLQVEHPVTEMITGQDLVEWQLRVAAGETLPLQQAQLQIHGHAFEVRVYAEDPNNDFLPQTGTLAFLQTPFESEHVRIDTGVRQGDDVSVYYDPMIAKLIVWDHSRDRALRRLTKALSEYRIAGMTTNVDFLYNLANTDAFRRAQLDTGFIDKHRSAIFHDSAPDLDRALPLAALTLILHREQVIGERARASGDPTSPWHDAYSWRMNARPLHRFQLQLQDREFTVSVEPTGRAQNQCFRLSWDGNSVDVSGRLDDNRLQADIGGHRQSATAVNHGEGWSLYTEHGAFAFHPLRPDTGELDSSHGDTGLIAPMNGTIVSLLVAPGSPVKKGDGLLVMEAMKMEHTLRAPADGIVSEFYFQPGELVAGGAELMQFDTEA